MAVTTARLPFKSYSGTIPEYRATHNVTMDIGLVNSWAFYSADGSYETTLRTNT